MRPMYVAFATINYPHAEHHTTEFSGDKYDITAWVYDLIQKENTTSFVVTIALKEGKNDGVVT